MKNRLFVAIALLSGALLCALPPAVPVKNFPLVNQNGKPFQLHDFGGKYTFVSFVYSRCPMPKMCPLTMKLTKSLLLKVNKELPSAPVQFLFVTLDPDHDSPVVLRAFSKQHHLEAKTNVVFATGNPQTLSDLAAEFNVIGIPQENTISHNLKSILLDPNLVDIAQYKENEWKPEQVIQDIRVNTKTSLARQSPPSL